jgi:predicted Rossmann-fold nucleotide-binding protein
MLAAAAAIVALPGGFGIFHERFRTPTLIQSRSVPPRPVVLIDATYWRYVFDADSLSETGSIGAVDTALFWYVESAAEALDGAPREHRINSSRLFAGEWRWTSVRRRACMSLGSRMPRRAPSGQAPEAA